MNDEQLYLVYWKSANTGAAGHGSPMSKTDAEAWVAKGNREWSGMVTHWIEPVKPEEAHATC